MKRRPRSPRYPSKERRSVFAPCISGGVCRDLSCVAGRHARVCGGGPCIRKGGRTVREGKASREGNGGKAEGVSEQGVSRQRDRDEAVERPVGSAPHP